MRSPAVMLILGLGLHGCSGYEDDPILRLSAAESLEAGTRLLQEEKYRQARPYLIHAFEIEPNSVNGREGLLLAADSLFKAGGQSNYVKAQGRYRNFLNRFPTSEHAAYAQYQIGMSGALRLEKPDRDQSLAGDALEALEAVRRLYPTSEYSQLATAEIERVRHHLARHELIVGRFYLRYQRFGTARAAIDRLESLLEDYPAFPETDAALLYLCRAYNTGREPELRQQAYETCGRLKREFPDSDYIKKIPKNLGNELDVENVDTVVPADNGL